MITKLTNGLLVALLMVGFWWLGILAQIEMFPPEIKVIQLPPEIITVTEVVEEIVYVELPSKNVYIINEKLVTEYVDVPIKVHPFETLEDLEVWVENYDTHLIFWGEYTPSLVDCEDFVFSMIYWAIQDGYLMTSEFLRNEGHMVAAAPIGNSMYYIEATDPSVVKPFKAIWFGYYLDNPELFPAVVADEDDDDDEPVQPDEPIEPVEDDEPDWGKGGKPKKEKL